MPILLRLLLAACLQAVTLGAVAALPGGVRQTAALEGFTEYTLDNGLKVVLFPDPSKPQAVLNLVYRVGSRDEGPGTTGHAHLLEHMLFKGTPRVKDLPSQFRQRGISWNATTSWDRTNYFAQLSANPEHLDWLIDLEAERMTQTTFTEADLASEMTVVRNEFEIAENNPYQSVGMALRGAVYNFHPYGRPPIGQRKDIEQVDVARLRAMYRQFYRPDNAVLVIAGAIDVPRVLERIARSFGRLPRPAEPLREFVFEEPRQLGERELVVQRVGGLPIVALAYRIPAGRHPDVNALTVLAQMLQQGGEGVLYRELVLTQQAAGLRFSLDNLRDPGLLTVVAAPVKPETLPALRNALVPLLENDLAARLTPELMDAVKQEAAVAFERMAENPAGLAMFLTDFIVQGDWRLYFARREGVAAVTLEDVQRVARQYLVRANRSAVAFLPAAAPVGAEIGEPPPLAQQIESVRAQGPRIPGESLGDDPAVLEQRTQRLSPRPGWDVAVLHKRLAGERVQVAVQFLFGTPQEGAGRLEASQLGRLLFEGTPELSRAEVQRRLVALKAAMRIETAAQGAAVRLDVPQQHLDAALALAADLLRRPRLDEADWNRLRATTLGTWDTGLNSPQARIRLMQARLHNRVHGLQPGDVDFAWAGQAQRQAFEQITLERLREFHRTRMGAGRLRASAVGTLPAARLADALQTHFGDWGPSPPFERFVPRHVDVPGQRHHARLVDRPNAQLAATLYLPMQEDDPDHWPLQLVSMALSDGPDSRLWRRLRDALGASYSVGGGLSAPVRGDRAAFGLQASFPGAQTEAVLAAIGEEIERLRRDGVTAEELGRARSQLLEQRRRSRLNEGTLLSLLHTQMDLGTRFDEVARREALIAAVTVEDANRALRRHLVWPRFVVMTASDQGRDEGLGTER